MRLQLSRMTERSSSAKLSYTGNMILITLTMCPDVGGAYLNETIWLKKFFANCEHARNSKLANKKPIHLKMGNFAGDTKIILIKTFQRICVNMKSYFLKSISIWIESTPNYLNHCQQTKRKKS